MSYRIKVPGHFCQQGNYGPSYYAVSKHGYLSIVGIDAPARMTKRYTFWFDDAMAIEYGISYHGRRIAMIKVSHKPFEEWAKAQNKTQHRLQPVLGNKNDLLRIVSNVYFTAKPSLRQRIVGWVR
ncbi:hypothetical protein [Lactiplantibacillus paraxiangfangensis]|uniref:hypothetical protein n=1 Tax=Lactiplantibacillus paraxiangfangensis TaxID=3076224 RepID=UPI0030C6C05A